MEALIYLYIDLTPSRSILDHATNLIFFRLPVVFENLYKHGQVHYACPSPNLHT